MKTFQLYLSTMSVVNPPINKTSLGQVTWVVNWDALFQGVHGNAQVAIDLRSDNETGASSNTVRSSIRAANLSSPYGTSNNGLILGRVSLIPDPVTATYGIYECDTTMNTACPICGIPSGSSMFTLSFVDDTESVLLSAIPDWDAIIYFTLIE